MEGYMNSCLVHVGVRATDIDKTIRFWRDGLGLEVVSQIAGNYDLTDGYHNFRVFQYRGAERATHISGMQDYLHIGVRVPYLVSAAQRFTELGYKIAWEGLNGAKPYDPTRPPSQAFKVEDPDGIIVDVTASDEQWPGVELGKTRGDGNT
ncbi:MAG: VOC family protein [Chloroflexi bacterium]|nr:VOC family protein [Chloroflexota bacterium]